MTDHVFIVETELQFFAALAIKKQWIETESTAFYFTSEKLYKVSSGYLTDNCYFLSRNHSGGVRGKIKFIQENVNNIVEKVTELLKLVMDVVVYLPRLDTVYNNAIAAACIDRFGQRCKIALIPDGALNIFSGKRTVKEYLDALILITKRKILSPKSPVLFYTGNRLGEDSSAVTYVYGFTGMPYRTGAINKRRNISVFSESPSKPCSNTALIVGQNYLAFGNTGNKKFIEDVTNRIDLLIGELQPDQVYYARHPRAKNDEFMVAGAKVVDQDYLCVEELISTLGCKYVISCTSTVLYMAKVISPEINSFAVYPDLSPSQDKRQRLVMLQSMKSLGVELIFSA